MYSTLFNCGSGTQPGSYEFHGGVATIVFAVVGGGYFCTLNFYYFFIAKCFSILTKFVICLKLRICIKHEVKI